MLRRVTLAIVLVSLAACSGGGGSSSPGTPVVTPTSGGQSNFVRPKITFTEPVKARPHAKGAKGAKYLSAGADGVTVTLVSSAVGLSNISATTDLTSPSVCDPVTHKCTILGPPIPPGQDVLKVVEYDLEPTGSPGGLTEPANAKMVAVSDSTASTPAVTDPSIDIQTGKENDISILLYGVPYILTIANNQKKFTADSAGSYSGFLAVEDALGNTITGQYSVPITVTDSDSGTLGTSLSLDGGTTKLATVTLDTPTDLADLVAEYGGLAEVAPMITATATPVVGTTVTSGAATPFSIMLNPIVVTPGSSYAAETQTTDEIDLFAATGTGSTAQVTVSEAGYSDASYGGTFTFMPITPCAAGSADTVYSLTTADNLTFTDSAPTSNTPAPGSCTGTFGDTLSQTTTETFTYTTTVIGINKKNHNLLHRR